MTGLRFGSLVVRERDFTKHEVYWVCECDCGNRRSVRADHLRSGKTRGCYECRGKRISDSKTKHGESRSRLYYVWRDMITRCENPNVRSYKDYGGRGIRVCRTWRDSYKAFREWAYATGYDPDAPYSKCTLDRIDVDGDYEPRNCRWADAKQQAANRRIKG